MVTVTETGMGKEKVYLFLNTPNFQNPFWFSRVITAVKKLELNFCIQNVYLFITFLFRTQFPAMTRFYIIQ